MSDLKVVQLSKSNFRDIASTLRNIADEIEAGELGELNDVVLVSHGHELRVYHMGKGDVGSAYILMNCACRKLEHPVIMSSGGYKLGSDT